MSDSYQMKEGDYGLTYSTRNRYIERNMIRSLGEATKQQGMHKRQSLVFRLQINTQSLFIKQKANTALAIVIASINIQISFIQALNHCTPNFKAQAGIFSIAKFHITSPSKAIRGISRNDRARHHKSSEFRSKIVVMQLGGRLSAAVLFDVTKLSKYFLLNHN